MLENIQKAQQDDPFTKKALAILRGEEKAPNETIGYIVSRATEAKTHAKNLSDQAQELNLQLQQLKTRITELRGAMANYADDVRNLLIKEAEPAKRGTSEKERKTDDERKQK